MKSIMEEASSIAKAIEKGWLRAGKPHEFTVKVFEEPEKNFLGLTSKPAKVGIFFQSPGAHLAQPSRQTSRGTEPRTPRSSEIHRKPTAQPQRHEPVREQPRPEQKAPQQSVWSSEYIELAQQWLKDALALLGITDAPFAVQTDRYALKVTFKQPILDNHEKEKMLMKSWSYLLMQSLRQQYKRPFKGFKVILLTSHSS